MNISVIRDHKATPVWCLSKFYLVCLAAGAADAVADAGTRL